MLLDRVEPRALVKVADVKPRVEAAERHEAAVRRDGARAQPVGRGAVVQLGAGHDVEDPRRLGRAADGERAAVVRERDAEDLGES